MSTEIQRRAKKRRRLTALLAVTVVAGLAIIPIMPSLVRYLRIERM
jgi:hypothetical protein